MVILVVDQLKTLALGGVKDHRIICFCLFTGAAVRGGPVKKKSINVETDPKLLCTRLCGGNFYKEGEDPVLGRDEDYPDWLWKLRLDRGAVPLEELSMDDYKYWKRLKTLNLREKNKIRNSKKF